MKNCKYALYAILFIMTIGCNALQAQKAQEILGIAKEDHPIEYYQSQAELWKQHIEANPNNAYAHFQHYKATKAYLQLKDPEMWRNNKAEVFAKLKPIVLAAKTHVGNSFEYHLLEGVNHQGDEGLPFLLKAYEIDPSRHETYESIFVHFMVTFNEEPATDVAKRMLASNHFSNANLMWNRNGLETFDKNGIYLANGDMDTLPKWVLQYATQFRTDVLVINKWLMGYKPAYRTALFIKLNLIPYDKSLEDFDTESEYVDHLAAYVIKNATQHVYIGVGTPVKFFEDHQLDQSMYLVGTAFVYSEKSIDNLAIIQKNFQKKYKLEYLLANFQTHHEDQMVRKYMNVTYIPGIIKLKNHFEQINEPTLAEYYQYLLWRIAEDSGRKEEVLSWE